MLVTGCACLLVLQVALVSAIEVNLDAAQNSGGQDVCSGVIYLSKDNSSQVVATERVSHGYCDVTYRALSDAKNHCNRLCFTPKSDTCAKHIDLTIVVFSLENKNNVKIYGCQDFPGKKWCMTTTSMKVAVLEHTRSVATKPADQIYKFSADVKADCTQIKDIFSKEWVTSNETKRYRAKVEGIVVGCCLALIFLVVLCVMVFYYKSKPNQNPLDDNTVKVKVSAFTGIRETLKVGKRKRKPSKRNSRPPSRQPSLMSNRSGISASYEAARRMSEPRTELTPPEMMLVPNGTEVTDSTSTLPVESETKPLCADIP
ncbi:uncharacterized protein LOC117330591 isoform X1 [Pecten maximus]|uniref:uncharacterized protein LOC117330591 isoform X1 n=1 Tax=Pecten maximus TaxID=6579 RepID=UPI001458C922|nr:uncharacterized protein LOC117330591 isoform X1 [Pecten maximus]XP_033744894.1 uncharacterized protein LOC117330591 isoform X1 [Pecten maximus]